LEKARIADRIAEIVAAELEMENPGQIKPESKFIDDLGADSLKIFALITSIEEEFDITIDDSAIEEIKVVADATALVERMLSEQVVA